MTTSEPPRLINGHTVINDEPTPAPINGKNGAPIYWRQVRTLTLDSGEEVYGCAHCDYTSPNPRSIRPHLSAHNATKRRKTPNDEGATNDAAVQDVLDQLSQLSEITYARDQWRQRALKAERNLRAIRRAIGGDE